jgi:hypothetical protein
MLSTAPMHYNASGLFAYLGKVEFGRLKPGQAETLEGFMHEDFSARSFVRYDLPRGKFTSGFTNCTLLTSNEKVGIIHALYLSLGTPESKPFMKQAFFVSNKSMPTFPALTYLLPVEVQTQDPITMNETSRGHGF